MKIHLIPTPDAFAEQVREKHGPDAVLHPSNRLTACGKRMGDLSVTVNAERATCQTCLKAAPA